MRTTRVRGNALIASWESFSAVFALLERVADPHEQAGADACKGGEGGKRKQRKHDLKGGDKRGHGNPPPHQPAPAPGHHNAGNRSFTTHRRAGAARSLHESCVNAASQEDFGVSAPIGVTPLILTLSPLASERHCKRQPRSMAS